LENQDYFPGLKLGGFAPFSLEQLSAYPKHPKRFPADD